MLVCVLFQHLIAYTSCPFLTALLLLFLTVVNCQINIYCE